MLNGLAVMRGAVLAMVLAIACLQPAVAGVSNSVLSRLDEDARRQVAAVEKAREAHAGELDAYWRKAAEKRATRRARKQQGAEPTVEDYVLEQPPEYAGPQLTEELARLIEKLEAEEAAARGEAPKAKDERKPLPGLADYLAAAKAKYGFEPELVSEAEFKRRYAIEALALGLTREQIVRVYALETGGQGTYDMQSGVNPVTRKGKPISSAIGYAQLLAANSVGELGTRGADFVARLEAMAQAEGVAPERKDALTAKAQVLRRMVRDARRAGSKWAQHVAYAGTPRGMAMHMWNLDGDVGPWLQVHKLRDLTETAAKNGLPVLTGGQLELMNLAGPGSGLEMLSAIAQDKPTSNFFERGGWERNPVVQRRTASELLAKLDERIDFYIQKPEAVAFAAIFDELTGTALPAAAPAGSSGPAISERR